MRGFRSSSTPGSDWPLSVEPEGQPAPSDLAEHLSQRDFRTLCESAPAIQAGAVLLAPQGGLELGASPDRARSLPQHRLHVRAHRVETLASGIVRPHDRGDPLASQHDTARSLN